MNWQKRQQTKEYNHHQIKKINENLFSEFVDLYFELVRMEMEKYWTVLYSRNKKSFFKNTQSDPHDFCRLDDYAVGWFQKNAGRCANAHVSHCQCVPWQSNSCPQQPKRSIWFGFSFTGAKILILSKNHILKSQFSKKNSRFQILIFHKIHIFKISIFSKN